MQQEVFGRNVIRRAHYIEPPGEVDKRKLRTVQIAFRLAGKPVRAAGQNRLAASGGGGIVAVFHARMLKATAIFRAGATVMLTALALIGHADGADRRPSFVVILADDLGYGDTSPYGGWIATPELDRMAAEGLRFTDFHSSGNVCSPTRAGLLTGRYQQRAGIPGVVFADAKRAAHYTGLQSSEVTLAESLKDAGYATALFGKWHLGYQPQYNPVHHGFDEFRGYVSGNVDYHSHRDNQNREDWWHGLEKSPEEGYVTHLITRHAEEFIRRHRERPFFLLLAHQAVHDPYQGPGETILRGPDSVADHAELRDVKDIYRDMMIELDRSIGRTLSVLRETGIAEDTFVFFFSDNGANRHGSNQPWRGFKGGDWEGGHRVPAIAWWPGKIEPGVSDALTISLDVMPTLLEAAGVKPPPDRALDGVSLLQHLRRRQPLAGRRLFWNGVAVREGPWKLMSTGGQDQFFDLQSDPGESKDVSASHPRRVAAMKAALAEWSADVQREATPQPDPPDNQRRVKSPTTTLP